VPGTEPNGDLRHAGVRKNVLMKYTPAENRLRFELYNNAPSGPRCFAFTAYYVFTLGFPNTRHTVAVRMWVILGGDLAANLKVELTMQQHACFDVSLLANNSLYS